MTTFKVTTNATLVFEVDAPNEAAAKGAIYNAFKNWRHSDPLQGTRFTFDSTERQCANPKLMTTVVPGMRDLEVEEA